MIAFYLPRRVRSAFATHAPITYGKPSPLNDLVQHVNVLRPTPMCRTMTWHGSDKGRGWHNYTTVYSALLASYHDRPIRVFELGLGTTNPNILANMGAHGRPGASLRGWRDLFPQAAVYGADIDRSVLFEDERIRTFFCDQLDSKAIHDLWSESDLRDAMDVIIDDGLHTFAGNDSFLRHSLDRLRPGGIYVIEDITEADFRLWQERLPVCERDYLGFEFVAAKLPNAANTFDNNLLIARRR